jgi:peroxiredoxin
VRNDQTESLKLWSRLPGFSLLAANREGLFSLSALLARGPLIVEMMRGTWCMSCKKRLAEIEEGKSNILATGANLVYIAAETMEGIWNPREYLKSRPVSFPFLLDEDRSVTKKYGLYHRLGIDAVNIAHPATLVVDRNGFLRYIYRSNSQGDRAPLVDMIAAANRLER